MPDPFPDQAARDRFLALPRLGILSSNRKDGSAISVPVWFDWDGTTVHMFAVNSSPKVKRLQNDPRASLLVVNNLDEPEGWVAFDGDVEIGPGDFSLVEKLAARYWDLSDPARAKTLEEWRGGQEFFCFLTLTPGRIRSGA